MLYSAFTQQLSSVTNLLEKLSDDQYTQTIKHLGNATIGGHTRHIIELIQCLRTGYDSGLVDYVNRKRDLKLESNRKFALLTLEQILKEPLRCDKDLNLYAETKELNISSHVRTTFNRELLYNTEHTIHHLALIKVALLEMNLQLVDECFGMAYSTLKYKASLVQNN